MPSFLSCLAILSVFGTFCHNAAAGKVFERLYGGVPQGWRFARTPQADEPIKLRVALQQQNVALFEQIVLDVSTPDHPRYGKHMQGHEIKALLKPTHIASNAVISWLQDYNITAIEDDGDWVNFRTNVATANRMLDTDFQWYIGDYKGQERLRTLQYSVPEEVAHHINLVQPTTRFGTLKPMGSRVLKKEYQGQATGLSHWNSEAARKSKVDVACNTSITPQCLLQLYNVHYEAPTNTTNKIAFASFLEEYARYADLARFETEYAPYAVGQNFSVVSINGGLNDQVGTEDSGEANLDLQYIVGISSPVPVIEFSTAGRGPLVPDLDQPTQANDNNEPYLDYLNGVLKLPNSELPQVISHSYGENEQSVPESYARQVCNMFAQLGARGVSVLFSSGDSGVGDACVSNDGKNTTEFQPQFPAACPFLTSVGGTRYIEPEVAIYFSGGGFSRIFSRPSYQNHAVKEYLKMLGSKNKGFFNPEGRGFPDVAAQAYRFRVVDQGREARFQGTSCSSPTFAAIVALLNSARLSSGLPPLGFLNPFIYSTGRHALNDITLGGSTGCDGNASFHGQPNGSPIIPYASWNATKGWDPVTGYGTPDFGKLLKQVSPGVKNEGGPVPA